MDTDIFFNEWQRVAVDKAPIPWDQAQDLIAHAEWLQDGRARLNVSRDASIATATHYFNERLIGHRPTGLKNVREIPDLMAALGFAALVNGTVYFSDDQTSFKVVWYDKEVS